MASTNFWSFAKLRFLDRIYRDALLIDKSNKLGVSCAKIKPENSSVVMNSHSVKGSKSKNKKKYLSPEEVLIYSYLEKLNAYFQDGADNVEQIRNATAKLLTFAKSNDVSNKINEELPLLVKILKTSEDVETIKSILRIIELRLVPKQGLKTCISTLVDEDIIGALFQTLHVAKHAVDSDIVLLEIYTLLSKLALKDPDFSLKMKRSDTLHFIVTLMKKNVGKLLLLRPLLLVVKAAASGFLSCTYLGREGIVVILLSFLNSFGKNQSATVKLILETLGQLSKSKYNCRKIVDHSGVQSLLNHLEHWDKTEGFHKYKILKAILTLLANLADYKVGRNSITINEGVGQLYKFCHSLPLISEYDGIISVASIVVLKCLPRKWLPIKSPSNVVTFPLNEKTGNYIRPVTEDRIAFDNFVSSDEDDDDDDDSCSSSDDDSARDYLEMQCSLCVKTKELTSGEVELYKKFMPELELHPKISIFSSNGINTSNVGSCYTNDILKLSKPIKHVEQTSSTACGLRSNLACEDLQGIFSCFSLMKKDASASPDEVCVDIPKIDSVKYKESGNTSNRSVPIVDNFNLSLDHSHSVKEQQRVDDFLKNFTLWDSYLANAQCTKHVAPFIKIPHPDMNADSFRVLEPLYQKNSSVSRAVLLQNLDRLFAGETVSRVVYDYDALVVDHNAESFKEGLNNEDHLRLGKSEDSSGSLVFESRFECGNLRKAIKISNYEYELILNSDINTDHHHQWFYFEVSNMEAGIPYSFYIINCEKTSSQFCYGMKPLLYSVREASLGRGYWVRSGSNICYYRNCYSCPPGAKGSTYFTTYFTITFQHPKDVCYLAYHYPYSYTLLKTHLYKWNNVYDKSTVFYRQQALCHTLSGNEVPLITITSRNTANFHKRPVVCLTGRVHPGETNSSWVMKGTIDFLLSDRPSAETLRENFIIKIVPMLNPDGVINGSHRCSLTGQDLNRCWLDPSPTMHPSIFHTKRLLQCLKKLDKSPLVFCDYHGHSRRKNIFLYGCNGNLSWLPEDRDGSSFENAELLPKILHHLAPAFTLNNCCFTVEKSRESTARITVWRQLGVKLSYTMESSYCGCDQGPYKNYHLGVAQYEEMGMKFVQALLHVLAKLQDVSGEYLKTSDTSFEKNESNYNKESSEDEEFNEGIMQTRSHFV